MASINQTPKHFCSFTCHVYIYTVTLGLNTHVSTCRPFTRRNLIWIQDVLNSPGGCLLCREQTLTGMSLSFRMGGFFFQCQQMQGLFSPIFNQCCWFSLETNVHRGKWKKKTVPIPIISSVLLSSRHFISFPFCWFWSTRGSQRAPSRGGERHPRGKRSVPSRVRSFRRHRLHLKSFHAVLVSQSRCSKTAASLPVYAVVW